jgi:ubiquinone/menaquinone biosynthesis C-methylase UbiE
MITNMNIDHGREFDWGRVSNDYARYRDIYPQEFFGKLLDLGIGTKNQRILDLGTGSGVLPRHLYPYGAHFTGIDISAEQIQAAREISTKNGMTIEYRVCPAEATDLPTASFDVVTACQCFMYFDPKTVLPEIKRLLTPQGKLCILFMSWLPNESEIAHKTEELVLKYNPVWTGAGYIRRIPETLDWSQEYFVEEHTEAFIVDVPFTRDSWRGRIRACRGVGASLPDNKVAEFDKDLENFLLKSAPAEFTIPHFVTIQIFSVAKTR